MINHIKVIVLIMQLLFFVSCGNDPVTVDPEPFTDHTGEVGTATDIDGNVYPTIGIGGQIWMAENLKVTHFRNGDEIPEVSDFSGWNNLTTAGRCSYNNDPSISAVYGNLYNWNAVKDSRGLAPAGWHVPSRGEWDTLQSWVGSNAASKLKESGTVHWNLPNSDATNESGFSALPGGWRLNLGNYFYIGTNGYWWTRSNDYLGGGFAYSCGMNSDSTRVETLATITNFGLSVRCVKD